jgi:hypothetical protein
MGIDIPLDISFINRELEKKFGRTLDNKVKYRIVWSDSQIEHRRTDKLRGIQLLHVEVQQLQKYNYLHRQWVLEKWMPYDGNGEIATVEGGTYEPVWAFQKGQRPVWRAVEIISLASENGISEKATAKDYERESEKKFAEEVNEFEEYLEDSGPNYGNQTDAFVAPMFMDSTKVKK